MVGVEEARDGDLKAIAGVDLGGPQLDYGAGVDEAFQPAGNALLALAELPLGRFLVSQPSLCFLDENEATPARPEAASLTGADCWALGIRVGKQSASYLATGLRSCGGACSQQSPHLYLTTQFIIHVSFRAIITSVGFYPLGLS